MDPVSLIVAALVAGAAAGTKDTVGTAITDAYAGLKALLRRRFGGKPEAEREIEDLARGGDEDTLRRRIETVEVDDALVAKATELMRHHDPDGTHQGKYHVTITGGQGAVVGDNATVTMKFGE
jgi:hypothetical protein